MANPCGSNARCTEPYPNSRICQCYLGYRFKSLGDVGLPDKDILEPAMETLGLIPWSDADDCIGTHKREAEKGKREREK